jgi:branched-chain amino acid transport system substrate-binding protein
VKRRDLLQISGAAAAGIALDPAGALAASAPPAPFKVGIIWSYTGGGPAAGPELDAAMAAFQKVHGDTVAGRKVTIVRRDDTGVNPEVARRMAQELVVQEQVDMIAGLIFTANANTVGAISNDSKTPVMLVNSVATGLLPRFPYMTRWSFTTLELTDVLGRYAAKTGYKSIYVIYHDNQSGVDANNGFTRAFQAGGGTVAGVSPVPLSAGDFSPYIQRAKDAKPDAIFVFLLAGGVSSQFIKQVDAAGLQKAGVKILSTGDLVSENNLPQMGDAALGIVSAYHYSSVHDSALNRQYQSEAMAITHGNPYPSFAGCAMWDILTATYRALQASGGNWDTDKVMAFLKDYKAESPRGPIEIDADTRDIIQNIYLRRVEKRNGQLVNVEFQTFPMVHSPEK